MTGGNEAEFVRARRVLLDALEALEPQISSFVLVGAQAVYLHVGSTDFALAPFTTDADVVVSPELVADVPRIEVALSEAGFKLKTRPGIWAGPSGATVDFLVPEALAGRGTRSADLGVHGRDVARRVRGLEGALVEYSMVSVGALDERDVREFELRLAGPAALIVAKAIKISERLGGDRLADKDALDVLRLLRSIPLEQLVGGFDLLRSEPLSETVANETVELLPAIFGAADSDGVQMVRRAVRGVEDEEEIGNSLALLSSDLHEALV